MTEVEERSVKVVGQLWISAWVFIFVGIILVIASLFIPAVQQVDRLSDSVIVSITGMLSFIIGFILIFATLVIPNLDK